VTIDEARGSQRSQRYLITSNASDAAARGLGDITIDLLFVSALGASAFQMGLLNTLGSLAFVFASVPAGHLVDKYSALRFLRIGLSGKIAVMMCLAILAFAGVLSIAMGMLLCTLLGVGNVFSETAQTSAVPRLIGMGPERRSSSISKLIARLSAADQSMTVIVPALAGTGFALLGAPALLGISAALAVLALMLALRIRDHRHVPKADLAQGPTPEEGAVLAGVKYLFAHRELRTVTMVVALSNLGLAIGSSVEAIFIINDLGFGEVGFGLYASVCAVGGLIGAMAASKVVGHYSAAKLLMLTGVVQTILAGFVLLAAFVGDFWSIVLLAIHALGWGSATLIFNIAASSWLVELVPEALLGRVLSARRLFTFGAIPLGSLLGGVLGSAFGIVAALIGWVGAALIAVVWFWIMRHPAKR